MNDCDYTKLTGKVGILGGSFDPVTLAHIKIAEQVKQKKNLSTVIFLPNFQNPLKSRTATKAEHRLKMLQIALSNYPDFQISTIETSAGKPCFTIDTIRQLKSKLKNPVELYFIHGSDALENLSKWKDIHNLLQEVKFVLLSRNKNFTVEAIKNQSANFSSEELQELIDLAMFCETIDISAENIRSLLKQGKDKEIVNCLDSRVLEYIMKKELYRN